MCAVLKASPVQTEQGYKKWHLRWVQYPGQDDSVREEADNSLLLSCWQRENLKAMPKYGRKCRMDLYWWSITRAVRACFSSCASWTAGLEELWKDKCSLQHDSSCNTLLSYILAQIYNWEFSIRSQVIKPLHFLFHIATTSWCISVGL